MSSDWRWNGLRGSRGAELGALLRCCQCSPVCRARCGAAAPSASPHSRFQTALSDFSWVSSVSSARKGILNHIVCRKLSTLCSFYDVVIGLPVLAPRGSPALTVKQLLRLLLLRYFIPLFFPGDVVKLLSKTDQDFFLTAKYCQARPSYWKAGTGQSSGLEVSSGSGFRGGLTSPVSPQCLCFHSPVKGGFTPVRGAAGGTSLCSQRSVFYMAAACSAHLCIEMGRRCLQRPGWEIFRSQVSVGGPMGLVAL